MNVLGIESSCDETAAAVVQDGRKILSSVVSSQIDIHALYGGVVPEIASRAHLDAISGVVDQAVMEAGGLDKIDAIAVTNAPGLIGALLVGVNFAKSLAYSLGKPLIPVHHIRGHVASDYLSHKDLEPPFISLIVSGGHSHIVLVNDYTDYRIIGHTRDDAAGESFDKAARLLGLDYPGGAKMDALAKNGNENAIQFPRVCFKDAPYDFSFSGVKTSVINYLHNAQQKDLEICREDVAASYSAAICSVLRDKAVMAVNDFGKDRLVIAGGVSANSMLRRYLSEVNGIKMFFPDLSLCGDNGAMIASQGYYEYLAGNVAGPELNAFACKSIEE